MVQWEFIVNKIDAIKSPSEPGGFTSETHS
jgi:hypothetical protein